MATSREREQKALNRLEAVCRSKGWRMALRYASKDNRLVLDDLDVWEPDDPLDRIVDTRTGLLRSSRRVLVGRASLKDEDRIGHAAEALLAQFAHAGLIGTEPS